MQENDVRPPLEVEAPKPDPAAPTAMQEAQSAANRAWLEAGRLYYQIDVLQGELGEAMVRARNANKDYHKLKVAETKQHLKEATQADHPV